jgi:hypothetical protein
VAEALAGGAGFGCRKRARNASGWLGHRWRAMRVKTSAYSTFWYSDLRYSWHKISSALEPFTCSFRRLPSTGGPSRWQLLCLREHLQPHLLRPSQRLHPGPGGRSIRLRRRPLPRPGVPREKRAAHLLLSLVRARNADRHRDRHRLRPNAAYRVRTGQRRPRAGLGTAGVQVQVQLRLSAACQCAPDQSLQGLRCEPHGTLRAGEWLLGSDS